MEERPLLQRPPGGDSEVETVLVRYVVSRGLRRAPTSWDEVTWMLLEQSAAKMNCRKQCALLSQSIVAILQILGGLVGVSRHGLDVPTV